MKATKKKATKKKATKKKATRKKVAVSGMSNGRFEDVELRLQELQKLYDKGYLAEEVYIRKQEEIISAL